ncbi:hypothetical protein DFQ30_000410, partial [Apophysomyces sp. BC1015]
MATIKLPPILQPFSVTTLPKIHPHFDVDNPETDAFEVATRSYADRFKLYPDELQRQRLFKQGTAHLTALIYPVGRDELLQIGVDFMMWAFAFDDEYCDEGPLSRDPEAFIRIATEIQRTTESPEYGVSNDRYASAMRDLIQRLQLYASPAEVGRFVDGVRTYMIVEMWKAVTPKPSLNDYVYMRLYGGGAWAIPLLCHVIAGVNISQNEYENRRVRALAEMMASLAPWDADPYSYIKESMRPGAEKEHNLITVIRRQFGYSFEQSIAYYLEMRARLISLFRRLHAVVYADASPAVRTYVDGLIAYYVGVAAWCHSCRRYTSSSGLESSGAFEGGGLIDAAPEESFEPLGLPS